MVSFLQASAKLGIKVVRTWGAWCFCCPRDFLNLEQEVVLPFLLWISWLWRLSFGSGDNLFFRNKRVMGWRFCQDLEITKPVRTKPMADIQKLLMWPHMTRVCVFSPHLPTENTTHVHKESLRLRCWRCFPPQQLGKWWFQDGHLIKIRSGRYSPVASYSNKRFYFWNVNVTKNGRLFMLRWR